MVSFLFQIFKQSLKLLKVLHINMCSTFVFLFFKYIDHKYASCFSFIYNPNADNYIFAFESSTWNRCNIMIWILEIHLISLQSTIFSFFLYFHMDSQK